MKPITDTERAAWQRRAVLALSEILDEHRSLPPVVWRVLDTQRLYVEIGVLSADPLALYETWRDALGLGDEQVKRDFLDLRRWASGEWTTKRGSHHVRITIHVTVPVPEDEVVL